jgi:hypothetical protein
MWQTIGWMLWAIIVFLSISFAWGCRSYAKTKRSFQWSTGIQTFFWWVIAILFLVFKWNKLHILWIAPIAFFSADFFAFGSIPILSPAIIFFTKIFLGIVLMGVNIPEGLNGFLLLGNFSKEHFGLPRKIEVIKNLVKKRIQNDTALSTLEKPDTISYITSDEKLLMGLPEATIVTIVATYLQFKNSGLSDKKIFEVIERHRDRFGNVGDMFLELTLSNYIKYRVKLEHSSGDEVPITDNFIEEAIKETIAAFN